MKKNKNTLLSKIKEENEAISYGSNVLSSIENLISELNQNSILLSKVNEIKKLQEEDNFQSSKRIEDILNIPFDYEYKFGLKVERNIPIQIELKEKFNLTEHIKKEIWLNELEKSFLKYNEYDKILSNLGSKYHRKLKKNDDLNSKWNFGFILPIITIFVSSLATSYWLGLGWILGKITFVINGKYIKKRKQKDLNEYKIKRDLELQEILKNIN